MIMSTFSVFSLGHECLIPTLRCSNTRTTLIPVVRGLTTFMTLLGTSHTRLVHAHAFVTVMGLVISINTALSLQLGRSGPGGYEIEGELDASADSDFAGFLRLKGEAPMLKAKYQVGICNIKPADDVSSGGLGDLDGLFTIGVEI